MQFPAEVSIEDSETDQTRTETSRVSIPTGKGAGCKPVVNMTWGVRFPPHPCGWCSGVEWSVANREGEWWNGIHDRLKICCLQDCGCKSRLAYFMVVVQWENDGLQNRRSGFDSLLPCVAGARAVRARGCEPRGRRVQIPPVTFADIVQLDRTLGYEPRGHRFESCYPRDALWCKGNTTVFGAVDSGSSPDRAAFITERRRTHENHT